MIDTVTLFHPFELSATELGPNWRHAIRRRGAPERIVGGGYAETFEYDDLESGYHGYGENGYIRYDRASLPRLLFGENSFLIKDQADLDAGIAHLISKGEELGKPILVSSHFTRVDLTWQFRLNPAALVQAFRHAKHPRIHAPAVCHSSRSISWKGSGTRISFYDKRKQRFGQDGDVVRVEIQLRDRPLKEILGHGAKVTHLRFDDCYAAYRQLLCEFNPATLPGSNRLAELLTLLDREGWQYEGLTAFELYTHGLSSRQIQRIRKGMAAARPQIHRLDWANVLPVAGPPAPVELYFPA